MRRGIAMGTSSIALGLMALLAAFMIAAAICDLRNRSIPNGLNGLIAIFAIPFWIANGLAFWPDLPIQIGAAFPLFLALAGPFTNAERLLVGKWCFEPFTLMEFPPTYKK